MFQCPKGHQSTESDFCSECGSKIQGAPPGAPPAVPTVSTPGSGALCPDCGAPRTDLSSNFCEVCGYNFASGAHGSAPPVSQPEPEPVAVPKQWTVTIAIDPSLRDADSPEPPANVPDTTVQLNKPTSLIGRKSDKRGIHPEISLDLDDAVSHRHALLTHGADDSLTLRDVGSSNGTRLNGTDIKPLEDVALKDGDQITLGRWTRLTLKIV